MKLDTIPCDLLESVLEQFSERSRGTVKRWRRSGMNDVAYVYYKCGASYHLNVIAEAFEIVAEHAKTFCGKHVECMQEQSFVNQLYTEIENMRKQ